MNERQFPNRIEMPEGARFIIRVLQEAGYEACIVGGCVRDALLGTEPGDWDITTSARPEEVKSLFRRTVDTGIEHGTVTVLYRNRQGAEEAAPEAYEVTTYRIDGNYSDGRHPDRVTFTPSLSEDLRRRDFTINAMAYNEKEGVIDLFDGLGDLREGLIRCVGDPEERFNEDALRMMRALRFSARLDFPIEQRTAEAIQDHAPDLEKISRERVLSELTGILCSAHPERVRRCTELGLAPYIAGDFSETDPEAFAGFERPWETLGRKRRYLRFAVLCLGMDRKTVRKMLRELKADNETTDNASLLAEQLIADLPKDRYGIKCLLGTMTPELFSELLELKKLCRRKLTEKQYCLSDLVGETEEIFRDILLKKEPVNYCDLCVDGNDLIAAGVRKGPEVGWFLGQMLDDVRHFPEHNEREYLLGKLGIS